MCNDALSKVCHSVLLETGRVNYSPAGLLEVKLFTVAHQT